MALALERFSGQLKPGSSEGKASENPAESTPAPEAGSSCGPIGADESEEDAGTVTTFKPVISDAGPGKGFVRDESDERPVTAKSFLYFDKLERGGQCPVAIELVMGENWHINANPPSPIF